MPGKVSMVRIIVKLYSTILVLLILSSVLIPSYHHHADMMENSNCAICKVAHDLSTGDKPELLLLAHPRVSDTLFSPKIQQYLSPLVTFSVNSRASPTLTCSSASL